LPRLARWYKVQTDPRSEPISQVCSTISGLQVLQSPNSRSQYKALSPQAWWLMAGADLF
jgi:hypothetical protein